MPPCSLPPACPTGWYAVGFSEELPPGALQRGRWFARELVLWRSASGQVSLVDAHCPHLGAHLGHGGEVRGELLRCPFHGLQFDVQGACVRGIPGQGEQSGRPIKVRARTWPVIERCGAILAWYHPHGQPPDWEVPEIDGAGFGRWHCHTWPQLRGHPQETTENSVDVAHFSVVHGYTDVRALAPLSLDGPRLFARYGMSRVNPYLPGASPVRTAFDVAVHGLGFSLVDVAVEGQDLRTRHLVLSTPIDDAHIELRIAVAVRLGRPASIALPLALLPRAWATWLVGALTLRAYRADVAQDFEIWQHKRFLEAPALAEGDGPVGPYRRWVRQFYVATAPAAGT